MTAAFLIGVATLWLTAIALLWWLGKEDEPLHLDMRTVRRLEGTQVRQSDRGWRILGE